MIYESNRKNTEVIEYQLFVFLFKTEAYLLKMNINKCG